MRISLFLVSCGGSEDDKNKDSTTLNVPTALSSGPTYSMNNDKITLSWNMVKDTTFYKVARSLRDNENYAKDIANNLKSTTYTDTNIETGVTYYYFVFACNSLGCSSASKSTRVTGGNTIAVTNVKLSLTSVNIEVGKTYQLTATVEPSSATDKTVTWSSSNTAKATVSSSGLVTGVAAGTATITVTTNDGAKTASSSITVTAISVTGVKLSPTSVSVEVGKTSQLTATVEPSGATNKVVTWSSSETAKATVSSSGLVTGVAAGTATITATTNDGAKTASSSITVTSIAQATETFKVTSTSFADNTKIPVKHADQDGGANTSPQISISNPPAGTTHWAIIMEDQDFTPYPHWAIVNIPIATTSIAEGGTAGTVTSSYAGPSPGLETHTYKIFVYALSEELTNVSQNNPSNNTEFVDNTTWKSKVLGTATLTGTYK